MVRWCWRSYESTSSTSTRWYSYWIRSRLTYSSPRIHTITSRRWNQVSRGRSITTTTTTPSRVVAHRSFLRCTYPSRSELDWKASWLMSTNRHRCAITYPSCSIICRWSITESSRQVRGINYRGLRRLKSSFSMKSWGRVFKRTSSRRYHFGNI